MSLWLLVMLWIWWRKKVGSLERYGRQDSSINHISLVSLPCKSIYGWNQHSPPHQIDSFEHLYLAVWHLPIFTSKLVLVSSKDLFGITPVRGRAAWLVQQVPPHGPPSWSHLGQQQQCSSISTWTASPSLQQPFCLLVQPQPQLPLHATGSSPWDSFIEQSQGH